MVSIAAKTDLIDEIQLGDPATPDRLPAMLFLSALVHGILIIGVGFNPQLLDNFSSAISLEVTIVAEPDQQIDRPDKAEYLAQASQQGGGNTAEQLRASAPLSSASPIDNAGAEDGTSLVDSTVHEAAADEVVSTQAEQDNQVAMKPREDPQTDTQVAISLEAGSEDTLPLPQDNASTLRIHNDDPRQLVISADTRESTIAAYLDKWKRRVEAVGDDYVPVLGNLDSLSGSPTLEVSIEASGMLTEVIIRQSSGSKVLDQAALDILQRASPFDPFPSEIRADYDRLRFAYKWLFGEELVPATASLE